MDEQIQNSATPEPKKSWLDWLDRSEFSFFGFKPHGGRRSKIFILALWGLIILVPSGTGVWAFFRKVVVPPPPPPPPLVTVQVFTPDPARDTDAASQDGAVQREGFERAVQDADAIPNHLQVRYQTYRDEGPLELLDRMKKLYENDGATFFVMTMSGRVSQLREHFKKWHEDCLRRGNREPIIIATVASAPNLADASAGIVRWYVRSDEESAILAAYMRWKLEVTTAAVFYIADAYGNRGKELFQERFTKLGGMSLSDDAYGVSFKTVDDQVTKFLNHYHEMHLQKGEKVGVFIVGYGGTLRATIEALVAKGFDGPIASTSTLTEPAWQPKDSSADRRIVTVIPRLKDSPNQLLGEDRNVVYFFARDTLLQVLELTASNPDSTGFVNRWLSRQESHKLDHDFLANGDAVVRVDVVSADKWR